MKKLISYFVMVFSVIMIHSCIENDLSYPALEPEFLSLELDGQKSLTIDKEASLIKVVMGETADLAKVKVLSYTAAHDAEVVGGMPEYLDLTDTVSLVLRIYKDVEWKIAATQPIDRHVICENQAGDPDIDPVKKQAFVYVTESQPLDRITVKDMKLEPEGSRIVSTTGFVSVNGHSVPKTEPCSFPMVLDCVVMRYFIVEYDGRQIEWSVKFLQKAVSMAVENVEPWTCSAFVRASVNGQGTPLVEYRKVADAEWESWSDFTLNGTSVFADITGLEENTEYMVRVTNGTDVSSEVAFTTGVAEQLPNLSFDDWYQNGKAWMPNLNSDNYVWDSANLGTANLPVGAVVPTTPEISDVVKGKAARLETNTAMNMLAAGNIYVGKFVKVAGLGAELDWGYPFTSRPLALRGHYKYAPKQIDKIGSGAPSEVTMGMTDQCQIQILLTDWEGMFRINTSKKVFVDFENDPCIIAHGSLTSSDTDSDYVKFTIPLEYRNSRIPKYIVIVAAASRYGDYFTGAVGSVLKVDEFELEYDPTTLTEEEYKTVFNNII